MKIFTLSNEKMNFNLKIREYKEESRAARNNELESEELKKIKKVKSFYVTRVLKILCYVMLCYVMLRYVTLRYVMSCHVTLYIIILHSRRIHS